MCFFVFLRRTSLARTLDFGTLHKIRILGTPNRVGGFSCPVPNRGQRWWAIKTPNFDLTNPSMISKIPNCSITLFALSSRGQVVLHHCRRTEVQDLQVSFHLSFAFPHEQKLGTFAKSMNWQVTSEPSWVAGWILTSSCWLKHSHALIQISIGETSWSWKAQGSFMWTKARGAVVSVPFTCHRPAVVSISGHREKHSVREMETLWNVWWWVWYSP